MGNEIELEVLKTVVGKIDQSLEKMTIVSNDIGKILAVHEQRLTVLEKTHDESENDIKILHKRITELFGDMSDKLYQMEQRLELKYNQQQISAQEQHQQIQKEIQTDISVLENRMRSLENWRWWMMGVGVGFGFILAKAMPMLA
jgi:TolA-binding protein